MNVGFGEHKNIAIKLLEETINILEKNNIDYYLISGTLLVYVRHNDFIPWDDDIDLIVSNDIHKLVNINSEIKIHYTDNYMLKVSFEKGIENIMVILGLL